MLIKLSMPKGLMARGILINFCYGLCFWLLSGGVVRKPGVAGVAGVIGVIGVIELHNSEFGSLFFRGLTDNRFQSALARPPVVNGQIKDQYEEAANDFRDCR